MDPRRLSCLLLFIISGVFMAGCQRGRVDPVPMPDMANPASVYCQGLGYDEEMRQNELGQYGVCLLPDEVECDTWDFLAGRCGQEYSYCIQQGYDLKASQDGNIATCTFNDGSTCPEFAYFQGDCQPGENFPDPVSEIVGLANPASVYCQGLGYSEEPRQDNFGEYSVCVFEEGQECDSWDFLAGRCGQEHSYCLQSGYQLEVNPDGNIATCIFEDGSTCNEYQHFQGDCGLDARTP